MYLLFCMTVATWKLSDRSPTHFSTSPAYILTAGNIACNVLMSLSLILYSCQTCTAVSVFIIQQMWSVTIIFVFFHNRPVLATKQEGYLPQTDRTTAFVVDPVKFSSHLVWLPRKIWLLILAMCMCMKSPNKSGMLDTHPLWLGAWLIP